MPVDDAAAEPEPGSMFSRAMDSAASVAAALFTDIPFTGEVNLLTTSAFAPGDLFAGDVVPRGVAYLSIGAPDAGGRLAGAGGDERGGPVLVDRGRLVRLAPHRHPLLRSRAVLQHAGVPAAGQALSLGAVTDGSRNVGELYALDRWTVSPGVSIEYGGRYAHYDYLRDRGLLQPARRFHARADRRPRA